MRRLNIKNQISVPGAVMVLIIAVLLVKSVAMPALRITEADSMMGSADFDDALEVLEEYVTFGLDGEKRIQECYVARGDYNFRNGSMDYAVSAYHKAQESGADVTEKLKATYEKEMQQYLDDASYESALQVIKNAAGDGFDLSEKEPEIHYLEALESYEARNYEAVIYELKSCEAYPGADELMQEMRQIYETAVENDDVSSVISLSLAFGDVNTEHGVWNAAQEKLGEYKDWLSVNGARFVVRMGDGTACAYGSGADQLYVDGWSDLKGVYCYGSGAFGWTNDGQVYSTGMYSAESFGFSDIVQMVGNESRVFGLQSDGTVLCYVSGQGTHTVDFGNVKRLAMAADGRIALLSNNGTVYYETSEGAVDTSNTGVADVVFSGSEIVMLGADGTVSTRYDDQFHYEIEEGNALLLYPSKEFVFAITEDQEAVGTYRKFNDLASGLEFTSDELCLCVGDGDYWELETGCIVYLTQSGDVNVFYRYDRQLELYEETKFIMNIYQ